MGGGWNGKPMPILERHARRPQQFYATAVDGVPVASPWNRCQDRYNSALIWLMCAADTKKRLATTVVVSPTARISAIRRRRPGRTCNHVEVYSRCGHLCRSGILVFYENLSPNFFIAVKPVEPLDRNVLPLLAILLRTSRTLRWPPTLRPSLTWATA